MRVVVVWKNFEYEFCRLRRRSLRKPKRSNQLKVIERGFYNKQCGVIRNVVMQARRKMYKNVKIIHVIYIYLILLLFLYNLFQKQMQQKLLKSVFTNIQR